MSGNTSRYLGSAGGHRSRGVAGLAAIVIVSAAVALASLVLDLSLGRTASTLGTAPHTVRLR